MSRLKSSTSSQYCRPWPSSALWAAVALAIIIAITIGVNILIGRQLHWDRVIVLGVIGIVALTLSRRYHFF